MENNSTTTTTTVETKTETNTITVNKALFLLFAEFLGYASPLIDWAEEICDGKDVEDYKRKIIEVDANFIFNKMQKEYSLEDIRSWYDEFYPLILKEYEDNEKIKVLFKENLMTNHLLLIFLKRDI